MVFMRFRSPIIILSQPADSMFLKVKDCTCSSFNSLVVISQSSNSASGRRLRDLYRKWMGKWGQNITTRCRALHLPAEPYSEVSNERAPCVLIFTFLRILLLELTLRVYPVINVHNCLLLPLRQ